MLNPHWLGLIICLGSFFSACAFEGTITVNFKKDKEEHILELRIKDNNVWMVSRFGGNKKYGGYLMDLNTREFYTLSAQGKKVIIQYHADTLIRFYEQQGFKQGLSAGSGPRLTETNKVRVMNQQTATRYVCEKGEAWVAEMQTPLPVLIPLLRLLNAWGKIEHAGKMIVESTYAPEQAAQESIRVSVVKEKIDDSWFILPKDFRAVNFTRLMEEKRNDSSIISLIRDFGEF